MALSAINIFSSDEGKDVIRHLSKVDMVIVAGVCKVFRAVIIADQPYWTQALRFIAEPIEGKSSFEIFVQTISPVFKLHREALNQFSVKVLNIGELLDLKWNAEHHSEVKAPYLSPEGATAPEVSEDQCRLDVESSKKEKVYRVISGGLIGAITLYHADHLDFSVLESYIKKFGEDHANYTFVCDVAAAEYNKTKEADFARASIEKLAPTDIKRFILLDLIVKNHLEKNDLQGALNEIKPYQYSLIRPHNSFFKIYESIRAAALGIERLDIVDQLDTFMAQDTF
jgi:hypothetical protein